jgi:hypothetical protein
VGQTIKHVHVCLIAFLEANMRIYLDDARDTPYGWSRTFTVADTIEALKTRQVEELSLDNDLGEGQPEGYKVLDFLEQEVYNDPIFPLPKIIIHSSNASRVEYMFRALRNIKKIRQEQIGGK